MFCYNLTIVTGILREDKFMILIISLSVLLRKTNVSDSLVDEVKTYFVFNSIFLKSCDYKIMWKNIVDLDRPQMKIWRMCIACWTLKATNKHSGYILFIFHCNKFYTIAIDVGL